MSPFYDDSNDPALEEFHTLSAWDELKYIGRLIVSLLIIIAMVAIMAKILGWW